MCTLLSYCDLLCSLLLDERICSTCYCSIDRRSETITVLLTKNLTENAFGTRSSMCSICVPFQSVRIPVALLPEHIAKGVHLTLFPMRELGFSTKRGTRFLRNAFSLEIFFAMHALEHVLERPRNANGLDPSSIRRL